MLKTCVLLAFIIFTSLSFVEGWARPVFGQASIGQKSSPLVHLGERLFKDERFSTPNGDLPASCSHCHIYNEDPQGLRAYNDFFNRSWMSSRLQDQRRLMLRNSPTILDVGEMPRLHYDGEFASLEELVKGTLFGRPMGWLPNEEAQAFEQAQAVLLADTGQDSYRAQFQKAFGVDLNQISREEAINLVAKAVAAYCRTLNSLKNSAYDKFIKLNGLAENPASGESGADYGKRLFADINALEAKKTLRFSKEFGATALQGLKIFFRADGGNCVACHTPPQFTDYSFHNIGISQRDYDSVHGEGKFAALPLPNAAEAHRPAQQFRQNPAKERPGEVDLGFWNFVDLKTSPLRRPAESDDRFLQRMVGAFKTPTLRNLNYTQPYFHNGTVYTLEVILKEMMTLSEMARKGSLREADEELMKVKITAADVPALVAFLNSLNEDLSKMPYHEAKAQGQSKRRK
jgi:cytochrome c peroxidase